ncbi:cupin domain-containing protein [Amycolatopsis sp. NPDC023774]|uniref:cupin domain-containing protein n=1 Tax=Amycolatopsis sp. NPDC023774 TaxID=3155015 RepID=UPI0034024941
MWTLNRSAFEPALGTLRLCGHWFGGVRPQSSVDVRCAMAGRFSVDHEAPPPGRVPFSVALEGRCTVTTASAVVDLAPGDLLVLPHGDAHHVRVTSGRELPVEEEQGATLTLGARPGRGPARGSRSDRSVARIAGRSATGPNRRSWRRSAQRSALPARGSGERPAGASAGPSGSGHGRSPSRERLVALPSDGLRARRPESAPSTLVRFVAAERLRTG